MTSPSELQSSAVKQLGTGSPWSAVSPTVLTVDWSGRLKGERHAIWVATATSGSVVRLESGRTRQQTIDELCRIAASATPATPVIIGLDFSFSFPQWFVHQHGCTSVDEVWDLATQEGEAWLRLNAFPFWGRPGYPRPDLPAHFRITEDAVLPVAGIRPKSTFQVGGAGSVGTGSIRGMALLHQLRSAPCAIWPFDQPAAATAFELYPRLWTGPVVKSSPAARAQYLHERIAEQDVSPHHAPLIAAAINSEDAFDAFVSALTISTPIQPGQTACGNFRFQLPHSDAGLAEPAFARSVDLEGWIPVPQPQPAIA